VFRKTLAAFAFLTIFAGYSVAQDFRVGTIEFLEGEASLTRAGTVDDSPEIGDSIENFDLIRTGQSGIVVVSLSERTGMNGTLTVKPRSVFAVKAEKLGGAPSTEVESLGGSVGVKVKKLSGDSSLRVRTGNAVMGVRGTIFEVIVSVNDSLLVGCSEGRVSCVSEGGDELFAEPGQAVEARAGEGLRRVPVAVSSLDQFRDAWIADEVEAFRAAPLRALGQYARTYERYRGDFLTAFEALAKEPALSQWSAEHRRGVVPRANDIEVMKQKSAVAPKIMAVRGVLFIFERIYYRLDEVRSLVGDKNLQATLPTGRTVFEFYKELTAQRPELERKAAAYRLALRLYAERNEGREPVPGGFGESGDDDFFEDTSSFFD